MKLITLNLWGGKLSDKFPDFFEKYKDVDIFCFQEIYKNAGERKENEFLSIWDVSDDELNLHESLEKLLPNHTGFFRPHVGDFYGLSMFVKKEIPIREENDIWVFGSGEWDNSGSHSRNLQYIKLLNDGKEVLVANLHGIWHPKVSKIDILERIEQSNTIKKFLLDYEGPKILAGDFNLMPDTQSISILEDGYENLVKKHNITSTRTSFYKKECRFADYVLINDKVKDASFKVLPEEVSDHSALLFEFDI
jgi:endonuclease/exonuclease/phosphatase family metal-dependent hydrolase